MIYLVFVVLLNALLAVIFKSFSRFKIDNFQAIIFNYWVCVITGSVFLGHFPVQVESLYQPWFPIVVAMGFGFISVFNLFAFCTKTDGITSATVANKLSLVIPVIFSVFLYSETLSFTHILGILLSFPAIYLASISIRNEEIFKQKSRSQFLWPALLFLGSGLLDTTMKFAQQKFLSTEEQQAVFSIHIFAVAGCIGTVILVFLLLTKRKTFKLQNLIGGILLGIPNYFSIYFFVRMLNSDFIKSSAMIPLSNIGVLIVSSIFAIVLFKEKMNRKRWLGLFLAFIVIVLLATA